MPGYEPYLLCDFHTHTTWSDGRLSIRELVDLYGQTGAFDVIAITDHILRDRDVLARAARVATFGRRRFSVTEASFAEYLGEIAEEAVRARRLYGMLVLPGAEITRNHVRAKKNAHIVALGLRSFISADQSPEEVLQEIRRQGALSVACHPHHRPTRRLELSTCYLWDHRDDLIDMVDVWEAANRDDLFSVTSLKHFPYIANSDFHRPKHLYSWKTLVRAKKDWPSIKAALKDNVNLAITLYRGSPWTVSRGQAREEAKSREIA
jgi:hypothetical protein